MRVFEDSGQTNASVTDSHQRSGLSTTRRNAPLMSWNLSNNLAGDNAPPALVYPNLTNTEPGAVRPASAPSQASEPLSKQALGNAEADPVREAGLRGGSLAILREARAL